MTAEPHSEGGKTIQYMLGEISGKVDLLLAQGKIQDDRATALEARVRGVEGRQHWYAGVAAALSAFTTWAVNKGLWPHT